MCAAIWLALALIASPLMERPPDGEGGIGTRGGGGGTPPEPPWWPQFEREFRDYAALTARPPAGRTR